MNKFLFYYSNLHIRAGLLGGSYAGLETDEQGNINGFNPQNFALGFASGAGLSKGLQLSTKRLEKLASKHPKAKALLDKLKPKIDIMPKSKQDKGKSMENPTLKTRLDEALKSEVIDLPPKNFKNPKQFSALFDGIKGADGIIKTPYKDIKVRIPYAYRHFYQNTNNKNRDNIKSAFFETFRNPLFITKEQRGDKESVYFYKPFFDKDKNILNLFGIGVDSQNKVDFKTFYLDEQETRIKQVLKVKDENVLYIKK